jgi:hypothetical protein
VINMVYAPSTETVAETFLWYDATPDLKLGIAHLYEQNAFRILGSYQLIRETATSPSAHVSVGVQGIGTGNPGWTGRLEKNFRLPAGNLNVFGGIGVRGNEDHSHPIAGGKFEHHSGFSVGVQWEGHAHHPFVIYAFGQHVVGLYLIGGNRMGYMIGMRS